MIELCTVSLSIMFISVCGYYGLGLLIKLLDEI
jgi:hypothetical protein